MAGGYHVAEDGEYGRLIGIINRMQGDILEISRPSGGQVANQLARLNQLYNDLAAEVAAIAASGATWAGPVATSGTVTGGSVTATGVVTGNAGITSTGAAALDLSTIPGSRQPAWQHIATGRYGFAPSSLDTKMNLSTVLPFSAEDVYAAVPYVYEYIGQVAIRDNPENEYYDPDYIVPTELGLIAQYLIENNMSMFVVFNDSGEPKTVDYALFGAIANLVAVQNLDNRIRAAGL